MTQPPFRMDPAARFDDEVARIARENDADVIFQLVDREDSSMEPPKCELHDHTTPTRPERYTFTVTRSDGREKTFTVCKEHGMWIHSRGKDSQGKEYTPPGSHQQIDKLRPVLRDSRTQISPGKRVREPLGREAAGGGPGGRSMVPDQLPHIPPPPQKVERTYPPPYDGGRLVVGRFGGFGRWSSESDPTSDFAPIFDSLAAEGIIKPVGVVDHALQVVGVVKLGDTFGGVAEHPARQRPPPWIVQPAAPKFGDLGPGGDDSLTSSSERRVRPVTTLP